MTTKESYDKLSFQEKYNLFVIDGWDLNDFPASDRYAIGIAAVQNKMLKKSELLSIAYRNNDVEYLKKINDECPSQSRRPR